MTARYGIIIGLGELGTDRGVRQRPERADVHLDRRPASRTRQTILAEPVGFAFTLILALGLAIIVAVVSVEQSRIRRIPCS